MKNISVVLLLAFTVIALNACGDNGSVSQDDISSVDAENIEKLTGIPGVDQNTIELIKGYSASTEDITLKAGMLIMKAESDGGFFGVNLIQDSGNELMFNETVKYSGIYAVRVGSVDGSIGGVLKPGPAQLEIISKNDWTLSYTQEDLKVGESSNLDISGTLDFVVPAINFKPGKYTMTARNDAEFAHFSVNLLRRGSHGNVLVVNQAGATDEEFEFEIGAENNAVNPAGLWTMIIKSTGNWEVAIK